MIKYYNIFDYGDLEGECWKMIQGLDNKYQVSNLGRIRTLPKRGHFGKIMSSTADKDGYRMISIWEPHIKNKNKKLFRIHRLVMIHFGHKVEGKDQVNHINGVVDDNRIENLEWCTVQENISHSIKNNLKVIKKGKDSYAYGKTGLLSNRSKFVLDYNTGVFYYSILDAANTLGLCYTTLCQRLDGTLKNKTSLMLV